MIFQANNGAESLIFPSQLQFKQAPIITLEECINEFAPLKEIDKEEWEQSIEGLSDKIVCVKNLKESGMQSENTSDSVLPLIFIESMI